MRNFSVTNDHCYVSLVVSAYRSFPRSWYITGFFTKETRWCVPLGGLFTLTHEFTSGFSRVGYPWSLVLCLVYTYFICIADIYKQYNGNSTIGFRNKEMLSFNLFPMKTYKYHKQIYMQADLNFKLVRIIYTLREKKKCM